MQAVEAIRPAEIIRTAREFLGQSQREFARTVGSQQSLVSKYESAVIDPPSELVIHCMNVLGLGGREWISEPEFASLVTEKLCGDEMGPARFAIAQVIRCLPNATNRSHRPRRPSAAD